MTSGARVAAQAIGLRVGRAIAALQARVHGRTTSPPNKIPEGIEIEWALDMDSVTHRWSWGGGPKREANVSGRCRRCWGSLLARRDKAQTGMGITGLKCRVCGMTLEGSDAEEEWERMSKETSLNLMNLDFGRNPEYGEGVFVQKIFPSTERISQEEFKERISARAGEQGRANRLTRREFSEGSPGLLFVQAVALMAGLERLADLDEVSVMKFPDSDLNEDGSLSVHLSTEGLTDDPKFHEHELRRTTGTTMVEGMISAFACELAMKAISLTCKDEAIKTHDLLDLFNDLPEESRLRISADFPDIPELMAKARASLRCLAVL